MIKYYYAGMWFGEKIYLEEGMKMDWSTKIPLFFMKILPIKLEKIKVSKR